MSDHRSVSGPTWLSEQVRQAKEKKQFRKNENHTFVVKESVFLVFDAFEQVPSRRLASGHLIPAKTLRRGNEKIFVEEGVKVTIWDISRRNVTQHDARVASFQYKDGHWVHYNYGVALSRTQPPAGR